MDLKSSRCTSLSERQGCRFLYKLCPIVAETRNNSITTDIRINQVVTLQNRVDQDLLTYLYIVMCLSFGFKGSHGGLQ